MLVETGESRPPPETRTGSVGGIKLGHPKPVICPSFLPFPVPPVSPDGDSSGSVTASGTGVSAGAPSDAERLETVGSELCR